MPIFVESNGELKKLKVISLDKEKKLQSLVEQNLNEVLGMHILASEYTTIGGRIDTLAVDYNGAPVIIEYKRNQNDNVINQALSYLRWLKAQKVEFFEMMIVKKLGQEVANTIKVDWYNPRVVCIAENYSKFDIDTVEVIPIRMELFKYRYYENGIFSLEGINTIEQNVEKEKHSVLVKEDDKQLELSYHLNKVGEEIKDLFGELRSRILQLDDEIVERITPNYVAYRGLKNFAEIHIKRSQINIHLRPLDYNDPRSVIEKIPDTYKWTLDRRVYLKDISELDYVMELVSKSYHDVI